MWVDGGQHGIYFSMTTEVIIYYSYELYNYDHESIAVLNKR